MQVSVLFLTLTVFVVAHVAEADRCLPDWSEHGDSCYKYYGSWTPRDKAVEHCEKMGATLAVVKNDGQNEFVRKMIKNSIWLPMQDSEGWKFDNGGNVEWFNWFEGEGEGEGQDCAILYKGGKWNDVKCSKNYHYVCEAPAKIDVNQELEGLKTCTNVLKAEVAKLKKAVSASQVIAQTGEIDCGYDANWAREEENENLRSNFIDYTFDTPYDHVPVVKVGITWMDFEKTFNTRFYVEVLEVTNEGFKAKCTTWHSSKVHGAKFSFISV